MQFVVSHTQLLRVCCHNIMQCVWSNHPCSHIAQWYIYQAKGVYRQHLHNTSFYGQHCNPPGILLCQLTGYRVMFVYTESNGDRVTSPRRWTCTSVQYITLSRFATRKLYTSSTQVACSCVLTLTLTRTYDTSGDNNYWMRLWEDASRFAWTIWMATCQLLFMLVTWSRWRSTVPA